MSPPLTSLLNQPNLDHLRLGFDNSVAYAAALGAVAAPIPAAKDWVVGAGEYFFKDGEHMSPRRRELCIVSMLTVLRLPDQLSVHVYWGLMAGLSVNELSNAIFLGGDYGGVAAYETALRGAAAALANLQAQAIAALPDIDAAVKAAPANDAGAVDAARLAACRVKLPVQTVVPTMATAVRRALAGG
jgi:alkylhydroperoxidase/carboxymuconolactone decarboxylase family protein YurZ